MDSNVVECDPEREVCRGGPTLDILKEVQRAYEDRMAHIEARGGSNMTQMQLSVLRSWVGDLASQNDLLARAVEELEAEATASLAAERRRHSERSGGGKKRKICGNVTEMKIQNDTLQKENTAKEREIRRLLKDAQLYEQTISNLRNELSLGNHNPNVPKKDAEVMADTCCSQHCGNESFESCLCMDLESTREPRGARNNHADESPDLSIIEQSPVPPLLVSDASVDASTVDSPRKSVRVQAAEGRSQTLDELFFKAAGSHASEGKSCGNENCKTYKLEKTCSCIDQKESKKTTKGIPLCQVIQESGGCSPDGSGARAAYYHHKLMATLQILANKEETVRVQGESLRVAEARISALAARAQRLRTELDEKTEELRMLQRSTDKCGPDKTDISVSADMQGDCTCGLEEENMRLKNLNEKMQIQVGELQERVAELEAALSDKENGDQTYRDEIAEKEEQLHSIRQRLVELETAEDKGSCDVLAAQLRQAQVSIEDQTRELVEAHQRHQDLEETISRLNEELEKANQTIEEGQALRAEVCSLRRAAALSARRVHALGDELARARDHARSLDKGYKEEAESARTLASQLAGAHARGEALCADMRRVGAAVRACLGRMRAKHRDQDNRIKELETLNGLLQRNKEDSIEITSKPGCSKCLSLTRKPTSTRATETGRVSRDRKKRGTVSCECAAEMAERKFHSASERGCSCALRVGGRRQDCANSTSSRPVVCECRSQVQFQGLNDCDCSSRGMRQRTRSKSSESEIASCGCSMEMDKRRDHSRASGSEVASGSSAPTPPKRFLKKKSSACDKVDSWRWGGARVGHVSCTRLPREMSPSAELEQRLQALLASLPPARARWAHARSA